MAHFVTCIYCKERFDRDKIKCKQVSTMRYAHIGCAEKFEAIKAKEERDKQDLENYIGQLFGEGYVNARIRKQLNTYIAEYKYSYTGILKTLIYWFEIKHGDKDKANNGIGIVPYQYENAKKYYHAIHLAKVMNINKDIAEYKPTVKEIKILRPERKPLKKKRFEFLDEEVK